MAKGREWAKKLENWGHVISGRSLIFLMFILSSLKDSSCKLESLKYHKYLFRLAFLTTL